ncbi:MAG TPA: TauD/TfdA family dioxygenase [Thermoanaerobaculia bacterium]|nr:TauD/TfdA family dioxygenase [Thermoanaerobaculia bacterium]
MSEPMHLTRSISRIERKTVRLPQQHGVETRPLFPGTTLLLLVTPTGSGADLVSWAAGHREVIASFLLKHGGILFRGFSVRDLSDFRAFIQAVSGDPLEYKYRSTPRVEVGANIYTSTEYPADQEILAHNENSYSRVWPSKLFFYCETPSEEGGMTPISDSARVFDRISPELRSRFMEKNVMYVRNYGGGADLPWQQVFQTEDPAAVEEFCQRAGIELEWRDGGRLRTRQVCQAVARHPSSGRMLWFNQAHLFHLSSVPEKVRSALLEIFTEDELPRNACYGDGSPIAAEDIEQIREAYRQEQVAFPWQKGDILLLDNMAVAHARTSYRGERRIRVGMAEPVDGRTLES